jgi:rhodanese-related sulfurtransferase
VKIKGPLIEAASVAFVGIVVGLLANQLSPRGLSLTRDYFPAVKGAGPSPVPTTVSPESSSNTTQSVNARLEGRGLHPIAREEVVALFRSPQYEQEAVVFIDARNDEHYQESHIPGAYQFDRYYPERYLPAILPACLNAAKVIVYCTGGNCEDSELAAQTLKETGVPVDRLFVYTGGIGDWSTNNLPLELGARKSGILRVPKL